MQQGCPLSKFPDNICRVMTGNFYPVGINFKKYIGSKRFQQYFVNKTIPCFIAVFPPVIMKAKLQAVCFGKMVGFVINGYELFGTGQRTVTDIFRPSMP